MKSHENAKPLVSVIIPTYNRAYCLDRTIQSVLDQTYVNWELIVVDNCSSDSTESLVFSYGEPRIRLVKINNGGIIAASRNRGLRLASGDYVAFLDSDDWWLPQKLQISVEKLNAGVDFVYHDLYLITSLPAKSLIWSRVKTRQVKSPVFQDLLSNGAAIANSSVVVRRNLLNEVGGFSEDPELVAAEDYEAWIRVGRRTEAFFRIDKTLGFYWAGGGNISEPKRTLRYLMKLHLLYYKGLKEGANNESTSGWILYNLAKTNWAIGRYNKGKKYAIIMFSRQPISIRSFKLILFWTIAFASEKIIRKKD
jgi:glycosyltransferase involved in cell wall biosynthesis